MCEGDLGIKKKLNFFKKHFYFVGEIFSLPWFSKRLKTTYQKTTDFVALSLYFLFTNQYSLGRG
jgi:hypothetical protein